MQRRGSKFKGEAVENDDTLSWLPTLVEEAHRVCKNVAVVFCNWQNYDIFKRAFEQKFTIKNLLVWDKDWFGLGNNFRPNHEFIMLCCKTNIKTKSNTLSNILKCRRMPPQKMLHSCEKPLALLELLIRELTEEGQVVADFFVGSGSTLHACLNTNRNFLGFEISEKYYNIATERVASVTKTPFVATLPHQEGIAHSSKTTMA